MLRIIRRLNSSESLGCLPKKPGKPASKVIKTPTDPFTILMPRNPTMGEFYAVPKQQSSDIEAPKLRMCPSGGRGR